MTLLADHALLAELLLAIVLMPLAASVLLVFFGRRMARPDWLATASIGAGALIALSLFWTVIVRQGDPGWSWSSADHGLSAAWLSIPLTPLHVGLYLDNLSVIMLTMVTVVATCIFLFSQGYMHGDRDYSRFFAYLSYFCFAMLGLVVVDNLLVLFMFWELVGVGSYLLIGFFHDQPEPPRASLKAFMVNRVGDVLFLLGIIAAWQLFGTLSYRELFEQLAAGEFVPQASRAFPWMSDHGLLTLSGVLIFCGAVSKSAQFPLHTWLPDAMAGPTPVSALIHAATMVTAGVYLVVRMNPLFAASPAILALIAGVGVLTALIGASTALVQRDIKKVLAYSTVSQLGYMFLALGTGAWVAAVFHLVTHAFFKGLLFLGAGSVIHGMHDEQDMHRMGGLRKHMPRTFATFLAGAAALSGLPLMSGFFSKDEILAGAFASGGLYYVLWISAVAAAAMTAFYTWRMVALTFFGEERFDTHHVHPHESPAVMTLPLMVLAVLAVLGGALGLPAVLHLPHLMHAWLEPVVAPGNEILARARGGDLPHLSSHAMEWTLLGIGALVALLFAHRGFHAYKHGPEHDERFARSRPGLGRFLGDAWRVDALYASAIVAPLRLISFVLAVVIDQFAIDGLVNGAGALARSLGERVRRTADGHLSSYALWIAAGAVLLTLMWTWS